MDVGLIPRLHSASWIPQTTAYLLFRLHGTKLGHSWFQWIIKSDLSGWFDNFEKGDMFGHCRWMWRWFRVAVRFRNAADYHLPTFGPYGTKLGHSCFQWIIKSDLSFWFDNSEKGEVSGPIEWMWGWSRGCTPPEEFCRVPPTYFWATWHQTRAFLISVNNKSDFSGWFDN